ncbi:MAG: polysaccharide deacetylase family protein [Fimbriiglobus sp.]
MPKLKCSVSLDLDNLWSYMKTHGDSGWETYPTYLGIVVPRVLKFLDERDVRITWFIVGKDASEPSHHSVLREITAQGHEVGNHSFHHEPWLHLYSEEAIQDELAKTEEAIFAATGEKPVGFRGPGFSFSPTLLNVLKSRGYLFDCSTFPTYLGPLARMYYFATAKGLSDDEKAKRQQLFGKFSEGFRSLKPYEWKTASGSLLEIPVTTIPLFKTPFHLSYLLFLAGFSRVLARAYLHFAIVMCKLARVEPSFLLHPLDFMGSDDTDKLAFFPAMQRPHAPKLEFVSEVFATLAKHFELIPMTEHANAILAKREPRSTVLA